MNDKQEIIDAIESSVYMYQEVEGVFAKYKHDYLSGYILKDIDFEEYNQVGMSRLSDDQVEDTIQEVIKTYTDLGLTRIGWFVSPQSTPDNLTDFLEKNGFKKDIPIWGMVRSISEPLDITINDEFEYKEYKVLEVMKLFDDPDFCSMLEKSYGMPEGASGVFRLGLAMASHLDATSYVAYDKETNKPVAFSGIVYIPDTNISLLNGAATLPEYRKRGIYSSMLKIRHEKAKQDKKSHLILQAKEATSAPIAAKNGFKKICDLAIYVWKKELQE
ncbi:MAG: GNAT family N-acetyltransferase [Asgard group archaeon]|nr:GNAT family N-acetyltransferase [Asgard group archaeon]